MKIETTIKTTLACLLAISGANAQQSKIVKADLKDVTLYINSAELNHHADLILPTGTSEIVFTHVANGIDENSIQIGTSPDVTVMSVRAAQNYIQTDVKTDAYVKAEQAYQKEEDILKALQNQKSTEESVLKLLESNQKIAGTNGNTTVLELSKMADYYKTKYLEVKNNISALDDKITKQKQIVEKAEIQLDEVKGQNTGSGGQLIVQVLNNKAGNQPFDVTYQSPNASWYASYDLRAANTSSPLQIIYKANVVQLTGVDWKQVHLTLATGSPTQYGTIPTLQPWSLYYQSNMPLPGYSAQLRGRVAGIALDENKLEEVVVVNDKKAKAKSSISAYTQQVENQLNTTFDIAIPYDIASNGKPHSVSLKEYSHTANYTYTAVPRLDPTVYLMAELTDYEKLNLMPGSANIMFENMMVGKTTINPNNTSDTLKLSMGRDKIISIKRDKVNDLSQTKVFGGSKKQSFVYEISIKNNKKTGETILLEDQFPISTDKSMEITLDDDGAAEVNRETGILRWKITVPSGTTKKVRFGYTIKYPKDKQLNIY
ncbi:DUF4139 domain-containing protein [Sphingobacterium spiritivorum]